MTKKTHWPVFRGLLIAGVLFVQVLDAIPLPEVRPGHLRTDIARQEIQRWRSVLSHIGIDVTQQQMRDFALMLGEKSGNYRRAVVKPTKPFRRVTGTGQAWGLFAYPDHVAGRLVISGQVSGTWSTLYSAPDVGDGLLGSQLRNRRMRGVYDTFGDRNNPRGPYRRFFKWVTSAAFDQHPNVDVVEVRFDEVTIVLPGEEAPPETTMHSRKRAREP